PGRIADALDRRLPIQILGRGQAQELVVEAQRLTPGRPRRRRARCGIALRRAPGLVVAGAGRGSAGMGPALLAALLAALLDVLLPALALSPVGSRRRAALLLRLAGLRGRRLRRAAGRSAGRSAAWRHCAPGPAQDGQDPHRQHRERWTRAHDVTDLP